MVTLTRMTSSIEGIEKKMEKLDIVQQKVDNPRTGIGQKAWRRNSYKLKSHKIFKQKHLTPKAVLLLKYWQKIKT